MLIGHRKGDLRHLFADLIHHGVYLAPHRQIVGAPRRHAAQMRENDPSNAVDDRIEIRPGDQLALLLGDAEAKQRRLCFCMLSVCLTARRLLPLAPQVSQVATRL